ncbi:MAG TPA: heavy metal-associated domain-containing protein [Flavisolibacter sp.]|nr:heavy metal-associated domain-containing protein [Flavisolibacter sp.]
MKTLLMAMLITIMGIGAQAQVSSVTLQAGGLTCSMCSKAVYNALQKVSFVDKVQVDIKNQQYHITFKPGSEISFDALSKAVEDAGFSVAVFTVSAKFDHAVLQKDGHLQLGDQLVHFLNANGQKLDGTATFTIVDKQYTSAKNFKKYSALSKMPCVQSGHLENCCEKNSGSNGSSRVYHAII